MVRKITIFLDNNLDILQFATNPITHGEAFAYKSYLNYFNDVSITDVFFIGFQETYEEDMLKLSQMLKKDLEVHKYNQTPARHQETFDSATLEKLEEILKPEIDFYYSIHKMIKD